MSEADHDQSLAVSHSETARRGVFRIGEGAEMTYKRPSKNVMDVNHTLVDKRHRGKGLAHKLHKAMVAFARENKRQIIPTCPFVAAMIEQHPKDADLLLP